MTARRSSQINFLRSFSDRTILIASTEDNAKVTGSDYGFFALERDLGRLSVRARYYDSDGASPTGGTLLAESAEVAISSLPATVSLAEVGGSGVSATIYVAGVR